VRSRPGIEMPILHFTVETVVVNKILHSLVQGNARQGHLYLQHRRKCCQILAFLG
jgi:hypothetical protein